MQAATRNANCDGGPLFIKAVLNEATDDAPYIFFGIRQRVYNVGNAVIRFHSVKSLLFVVMALGEPHSSHLWLRLAPTLDGVQFDPAPSIFRALPGWLRWNRSISAASLSPLANPTEETGVVGWFKVRMGWPHLSEPDRPRGAGELHHAHVICKSSIKLYITC
jgi:hypothetical protein